MINIVLMRSQKSKKRSTKKSKKKHHRNKLESFGYQPDNPLTIYYAKYINRDGKV